jgi:hypothetical protein
MLCSEGLLRKVEMEGIHGLVQTNCFSTRLYSQFLCRYTRTIFSITQTYFLRKDTTPRFYTNGACHVTPCHRFHQWCLPPWLTNRLSAPQLMFIAYFSANCMSKDIQSPSKMEERWRPHNHTTTQTQTHRSHSSTEPLIKAYVQNHTYTFSRPSFYFSSNSSFPLHLLI